MQTIGKLNRMVSNQFLKAFGVWDTVGFKKVNAVYIYSEKPDLEQETKPISTTLTYENNRFTAVPGPTLTTPEGSFPIAFEYVQNKPAEGSERGKWLIDFAPGVENPFGRKEIGQLVYEINGTHNGTINLERDPVVTNALTYQSIGIDANMASFDTINTDITINFHFVYKDFTDLNLKITRWDKFNPTPKMFINYNQKLYEGGIVAEGSLNLTYIHFGYDYDFLSTATHLEGEKKYYIIDGLAYTAKNIEKTNFYWTVNLMRFDSVNKDTYQPPEDL